MKPKKFTGLFMFIDKV